ncbi:MAG: hypothetical protein HY821_20155 [Acidobacteria bacterium]|nr:hypothetical protein [Acidobacteriota bacterium]
MNNHPDSPFDVALLPADFLSSQPAYQHLRHAVHQQFQPSNHFAAMIADELAETFYIQQRLSHLATRTLDLRIRANAAQPDPRHSNPSPGLLTMLAWQDEVAAGPALVAAVDQRDHAARHKHHGIQTLLRFRQG